VRFNSFILHVREHSLVENTKTKSKPGRAKHQKRQTKGAFKCTQLLDTKVHVARRMFETSKNGKE
jgi:hypothetical protein